MIKPIFRPCRRDETEKVQELVLELYRAYPGEKGASPDINLTFEEFENFPEKGQIIVFEVAGQVIGYAIIVFFWSNEFSGDVIEIDELFIVKEYRQQGIGWQFFQWLEANHPLCIALEVQLSKHNTNAIKLYQKVDFKPSRNMHLLKLLFKRSASGGMIDKDNRFNRAGSLS